MGGREREKKCFCENKTHLPVVETHDDDPVVVVVEPAGQYMHH